MSGEMFRVEELTADVMRAVADRVAVAVSFTDLVYRESEIDALWSLADIAARGQAPGAPRLRALRDELGRAHDLLPDGRRAEAAEILRKAADLLEQ